MSRDAYLVVVGAPNVARDLVVLAQFTDIRKKFPGWNMVMNRARSTAQLFNRVVELPDLEVVHFLDKLDLSNVQYAEFCPQLADMLSRHPRHPKSPVVNFGAPCLSYTGMVFERHGVKTCSGTLEAAVAAVMQRWEEGLKVVEKVPA